MYIVFPFSLLYTVVYSAILVGMAETPAVSPTSFKSSCRSTSPTIARWPASIRDSTLRCRHCWTVASSRMSTCTVLEEQTVWVQLITLLCVCIYEREWKWERKCQRRIPNQGVVLLLSNIEISKCFSKVDIYLCCVFLSLQNSFEPVAKFYIPLKINFSTMPAYIAEVIL